MEKYLNLIISETDFHKYNLTTKELRIIEQALTILRREKLRLGG
jgi:hypothetical protein